MSNLAKERINLDLPRYDQSIFIGRLKHFFGVTDWRLCFKSNAELNEAKELLIKYRLGLEPPGTSDEEIYFAKRFYDSAFHPDTGEMQNVIGRMSFQVPGGMIFTGAMLTFYKSTPAVLFWQWANQSFNALVNYTNRNANSPLNTNGMIFAYASATFTALFAAVGLKKVLQSRSSTLLQRFVPFIAVAAANCVNIPLMRQNELKEGIVVEDDNGNSVGTSKIAAVKGISQVTFSRIFMAMPAMIILPIIMERIEQKKWLRRFPFLNAPFQTLVAGAFLIFMTPSACAIFNQKCSIKLTSLERYELKSFQSIRTNSSCLQSQCVYFNKGL